MNPEFIRQVEEALENIRKNIPNLSWNNLKTLKQIGNRKDILTTKI